MLRIVKKNDSYDVITYQLENEDNTPIDLTGATVNFVMGKKNKLITNAQATVASATSAIVSYQLAPSDTLVSGTFLAEFVVTFANGTKKTYPSNGYITVDIEQNLDTTQQSVVIDMIAAKQGDFEAKLDSILKQGIGTPVSAMNEYTWITTAGQLSFAFPADSNYSPSSNWFQVILGNVLVDNSLINRTSLTQFTLAIDPSIIKAGMTVRAMWVEPIVAMTTTPLVNNTLQSDYVETLKRYANYDRMQVRKIDNNNSIDVSILSDTRHLTFSFLNLESVGDQYITQSYVYTGTYTDWLQSYDGKTYPQMTTTGSWAGGTSGVVAYSYAVGATWETTVTVKNDGDSISLTGFKSSNGGLWKLTLNGSAITNYSCFSATDVTLKTEIYSNLRAGIYTVKGEFTGQDPAHPVANPLAYLNNATDQTITVDEKFALVTKDNALNTVSNKDFAFYIKPQTGATYQMVPYHGAKTAFDAEPKLYKDGDKIIDLSSMALQEVKHIDSFCLSSHMYGRNPDSGTTNLLEIWTNQTITKEGMYQVDGKMKVLQPISIGGSYVMMGVADYQKFDTLISGIGNSFTLTPTMPSTPLVKEADQCTSYCYLSSVNKNFAIAYRFNNPKETLRQGKADKDADPANMTFVMLQSGNAYKTYSRLWNDTASLQTGDIYRFSGDYIYSVVDNIYNLLSI
jgi:hypothetical protein